MTNPRVLPKEERSRDRWKQEGASVSLWALQLMKKPAQTTSEPRRVHISVLPAD
jgi:hypothetical protein